MRPTEPLTGRDADRAFGLIVPTWQLQRLDTRRGTADVARELKASMHGAGCVTACDDGPYSNGENPEWWSFHVDQRPGGFDVRVTHTVRATGAETVLRAGSLTWNRLANMATLRALELQRAAGGGADLADAPPGTQGALC